jgi:hypothetical protein
MDDLSKTIQAVMVLDGPLTEGESHRDFSGLIVKLPAEMTFDHR